MRRSQIVGRTVQAAAGAILVALVLTAIGSPLPPTGHDAALLMPATKEFPSANTSADGKTPDIREAKKGRRCPPWGC